MKDQGNLEGALESYQKAIDANPDYAEAFNNLGNIYKEMGNIDKSLELYQKALLIKPEYLEAQNNLDNAASLK